MTHPRDRAVKIARVALQAYFETEKSGFCNPPAKVVDRVEEALQEEFLPFVINFSGGLPTSLGLGKLSSEETWEVIDGVVSRAVNRLGSSKG